MESDPNGIKIEPNENYSNILTFNVGSIQQHHLINHSLNPGNFLVSPGQSRISSPFSNINTSKQRWNESPEAKTRRLARNAERMRERRSRESDQEYRKRLARNAEANRMRRHNENEMERAMRLVRNAARQRLRRAMETSEQRAKRLAKLAERMRHYRANETSDQRKDRLAEMAARARQRIARETSEERKERLRKLNDYAKKVRLNKKRLKENSNNNLNQELQQSEQLNQTDQNQQQQIEILDSQQNYVQHQTLANSIEYYQNMFINQALRPNMNKEIIPAQLQQNLRFPQNTHTNISLEDVGNPVFQQNLYEAKPKLTPYGTVASTIEYYQNKFIKEKPGEDLELKNASFSQESNEKIKHHQQENNQQQIQNTQTQIYNQFPYINNFPNASTTTSPSASSVTQQTYYPMYHNGFQLGIPPAGSVPPPFTPVHFQTSTIQGVQSTVSSYNLINPNIIGTGISMANNIPSQQLIQDFPKPVRGRPRKFFNNQDFSRIPSELQEEDLRHNKVNTLLENEINQMIASPKQHRRGRGQETETERRLRLNKMAAHQRHVRANETAEERAIRLKSLSERARIKRAQIRQTESEDQKRGRLSKQAEYARLRRLKSQTPECKRRVEERAKELYAQLHTLSSSQNQQSVQQIQHQQLTANTNDFTKNPGKDYAQSENNDVLKILEPIIVMKTK